jgi:hypothetical protein
LHYKQLAQQQRQIRLAQVEAAHRKWYTWASRKYWKYRGVLEEKVERLASRSSIWTRVFASIGVKPKGLATGCAEGTILFKLSSPVLLPLQLWIVTNYFKRQRSLGFYSLAPVTCEEADSLDVSSSQSESEIS